MPGKKFQVWVPQPLQRREGRAVIVRRFTSLEAGESWQADEKSRLKKLAIRVKEKREDEAAIGKAHRSITFTAAKGLWMAECDATKATIAHYKTLLEAHVMDELGPVKVSAITRARVREFLDRRRKDGVTEDTCRRLLQRIRAILAHVRDEGYRVDATVWKIRIDKQAPATKRVYDPDVIQRLIDSAAGQDRAMLQVCAWTGLRMMELAHLSVDWVRRREGRIYVPADKTKNHDERSIPLFDELEALLVEQMGPRKAGRVFRPVGHGSDGKAWTKDGMVSLILRLLKHAKLQRRLRGWHDLRHHYASDLIQRGATVREVMGILGWTDLATAMKYLHTAPGYFARIRDQLQAAAPSQIPSQAPIPINKKAGGR